MFTLIRPIFAGRPLEEAVLIGGLTLSLLFSMISISLTQIFLAAALFSWGWLLIRRRRRFEAPVFFLPLAVYSVLTLLASANSVNPKMSFWDSRELLIFLALPITLAALRRAEDLAGALAAILLSAVVNGVYAIAYAVVRAETGERVEAFMSHYMTQAGIAALFASFALGILLFAPGRRPRSGGASSLGAARLLWAAGLFASSAAIVLTLTRSAWVGVGAALVVLLLLWKPKALLILPILAALAFFAAPASVRNRALSIFTMRDASNIARVQYFKAGMKIIADYPLLGTGPDTVDMVFQNPKYELGTLAKHNVHLHSNIVQIAAERGVVTLLAWLAFVALAFVSLLRKVRKPAADAGSGLVRVLSAGALAALTAFFVAGFFEYNFGDSEITFLLLVILALPFAAEAIAGRTTAPESGEARTS